MEIIRDKIKLFELKERAGNIYGSMVKVVVDVEKGLMAISGELHSDELSKRRIS